MACGGTKLARLSSGYRMTIPKAMRTKLGIVPGQRFVMREKEGTIVLVPVPADPIRYLWGICRGEPSMADELLRERARDLEHE